MNVHDFYKDFCRRLNPPPALPASEWTDYPVDVRRYFETRGVTLETITTAGVMPLTPDATPTERAWYKEHIHAPRTNTKGDPAPCVSGIGFPYFIDGDERFGRIRGLQWTPEFCEYYTEQKQPVPRFLSPGKKKVEHSSHLYILPSDREKLKKSSTIACLVEGETKTLALSSDLPALENEVNRYAAVGISGVEQFLSAPETTAIVWKNRIVYIFFDADSLRKPEVAHAEMKIAAFLVSRGARAVKSCVWKEERGKGYDDYQVFSISKDFPRDFTLSKLLKRAVPTFRKYAPSDDYEGFPLQTYCSALARVPDLKNYHVKPLLEEIASMFKRQGLKVTDVKECLEQETLRWERERAKQLVEKATKEIQEQYGISYIPDLPKGFKPLNGMLYQDDTPICNMFIIKKYISTQASDQQDYYLLGFKNKELEIPSNKFSKYRDIAELFNRNQEILHDSSARAVQKFVSQYWLINKSKPIPVVSKHTNTGWDKDGVFRLPSVDEGAEYDRGIKDAFHTCGDPEIEREYIAEIYRTHNAALNHLLSLCAPLVNILHMPNYTVIESGTGGKGKTTNILAALAQYGNCENLKFTMDATKVGQELVCSLYRDLPILMDEANTGSSGDGVKMMQTFINTIYGFDSGKGRARGGIEGGEITLRNVNEYKGLLFLTSERSLSTIMSVARNMTVGGIYRRVLEIPCDNPDFPLWHYEKDKEKTFFDDLYHNMKNHYGHFGAEWIRHISQREVQERIIQKYKFVLEQFGKIYSLKGTENLWCLVEAITPEVELLLGLEQNTIANNLKEFIAHILDHNQQQIDNQIHNTVENFMECLDHFMNENLSSFVGLSGERDDPDDIPDTKKVLPTRILGKYESSESNGTEVWLTIPAMDELCNKFGLNKNGVLEQLKAQGKVEWSEEKDERDPRKVKVRIYWYVTKWIYSKTCRCYHLYLEPPKTQETNEDGPQDDLPLNA